jgi:hypothetical protein
MLIRKLLPVLFILVSPFISAQKKGLEYINKNDLKAYMTFFASDNMKGRDTGTPENEIAALFLKTSIMRLGLKPDPETGDYIQKVPLVSSEIKAGHTCLRLSNSEGRELFSTDSLLYLAPPSKTVESSGSFVFAGFGISDSVAGYDDYKGIDVKDKIIMIMTGMPHVSEKYDPNSVINIDIEQPKIIKALSMGVKTILYVYDPRSRFRDAYASGLADMGISRAGSRSMSLKPQESSPPLQIVFITRYAADRILSNSGNTLSMLEEKIIKENKPSSFSISDINVTMSTFIETSNLTVSNIIGIVEGSDPVLKDECIIYTAHFDHVGVNQDGEVFNGADDNASGSMALLEVAQAFENLRKKPMRSIVFAWVNGEEKGLLGSKYYTEHPVFSLDNTLIDINLDMVGRSRTPADTGKFMGFDTNISGKGEILLYTDQRGKDVLQLIGSASRKAGIKALNMGKFPLIGSSDYASFMDKGVPAMLFFSGEYPDLHTIHDDVEKIDFDKMERVSKMVFLLGYDIANMKNRFVPDTIE